MDNHIMAQLQMFGVKPAQARKKAHSKKADKLKQDLIVKLMKIKGGSKVGDWFKKVGRTARNVGRKVGQAFKNNEARIKSGFKALRKSDLLRDRLPTKAHEIADTLGYGKPKRKLSPYNMFVKKMRLQGYSMGEIGHMWRQAKAKGGGFFNNFMDTIGNKIGNKIKNKVKSIGNKVGKALKSNKTKNIIKGLRKSKLLHGKIDGTIHNAASLMGYGKPKRKLSPYNKFVKKMRLQGYSMSEIGQMWRQGI